MAVCEPLRMIQSIGIRVRQTERYGCLRDEAACLMIPIHDKPAAAAAAILIKRKIEGRAPQAAEAIALGRSSGDLPTGHRASSRARFPMTQQNAKSIAGACRKRKAAGRSEIGRCAILRQFGDNAGDRGRFQRLPLC